MGTPSDSPKIARAEPELPRNFPPGSEHPSTREERPLPLENARIDPYCEFGVPAFSASSPSDTAGLPPEEGRLSPPGLPLGTPPGEERPMPLNDARIGLATGV